MSFQETTQRLVAHSVLFLLLSVAVSAGQPQVRGVGDELCKVTEPLTLNETFYRAATVPDSLDVYAVELPGPGVLSIFASAQDGGAKLKFPRIALIEKECGEVAISRAENNLIRETPQSLLLQVRTAQTVRFAVMAEDPATILGRYKLQVAFAEVADRPEAVFTLGVNPPEKCSIPSAPALGEDPLRANRFIALDRDLDLFGDIEPEDCDILDGRFAEPGVVAIESEGSPLEASFFTGLGCAMEDRVGGGVLGLPGSGFAVPVHAGSYRMVLEPMDDRPVAYSMKIKHYGLCQLGELDDHGSLPLCASPLEIGSATEGRIDNVTGGDEDFFTFSLDGQRTVAVDITDSVDVVIYDKEGQRLSVDRLEGTAEVRRVVRTLGQGRYYLGVYGSAIGGADYTLSLNTIADP